MWNSLPFISIHSNHYFTKSCVSACPLARFWGGEIGGGRENRQRWVILWGERVGRKGPITRVGSEATCQRVVSLINGAPTPVSATGSITVASGSLAHTGLCGVCLALLHGVCLKLRRETAKPRRGCGRSFTHAANSICSGSTAYGTPVPAAGHNFIHCPADSRPARTPTLLWFSWFSAAQPTMTASVCECLFTVCTDLFYTFCQLSRPFACLTAGVSWHLSAFLSPSLAALPACLDVSRSRCLLLCLSGYLLLTSCLLAFLHPGTESLN